GANSYGQLGLGHKEDVLSAQQLSDFCKSGCIKQITGGGGHSAVVTDEGSLFVCGLNKDGQLGLGHTEEVLYFTPCKSLLGCAVQQVACGWDFTIILTENGQVLSCGSNSFGQLGVPHGPRRCVIPQAIEVRTALDIELAYVLLKGLQVSHGTVFQWGTGLASSGRRLCPGQTLPLFLTAKEPSTVTGKALISSESCIHSLSGNGDTGMQKMDAGELYVWGSNKHGQLASQAAFLLLPQRIEAHCFQNEKIAAVWSGWTHLVAQTVTGKVFTWGRADYGQLGRTVETREGWQSEKQDPSLPGSGPQKGTPSCLPCLTGATEVGKPRLQQAVSVSVSGGVCHSWGWNEHGMCGDGTEADVWAPKPVPGLPSSLGLHVGCGAGHSLALCQLPALPDLGQHLRVTSPSPDAIEEARSQVAMEQERNQKERHAETSPQAQSDRFRNGGL
ncbi:hypothetical protein MJT46_019777, partial [Ovis ammon polii x Ovis aries]